MLAKSWLTTLFGSSRRCLPGELQQRADEGGSEAQNNLGAFLANSDRQSDAIVSYRKAADAGHPMAQTNLGLMCTTGDGIGRDDAQAQHWFGRAAAQGYAAAQFHLGRRCHRVSLTLPDHEAREARIEAFKWLRLASAQSYPNAEVSCERVNIGMQSEDVVEGNRRIVAFLPTPEQR
jgi:TPR repeat protein